MQHSKCCVVSQPPWVQIPALPPLPPGPIGAGRFCYARKGVSACECCLLLLVAPLVFRAPEAPAAVCAGGRRPARSALFVAPLVFRAPEGPAVGPGCFVCPWAAARPRAVRAASFARRVASKPGQAPPPPTGTAARPLTALRRPPHQWGWVADVCLRVVSKPGQASRLEARSILSFACNSLMPAVCGSVKSPEFQRLNFKA